MRRYFVISISCILFVIVVVYLVIDRKDLLSKQELLIEQNEEVRQINSLLYGNMKLHYIYAERTLQDMILWDKSLNKVTLSDLVDDNEKLVFKFSPSNCSSCIQSSFAALKKIANIISDNQIIIIADKANRREIQALSNSMHLRYPIYLVDEKEFNDILREENIPFTFVIGRDLIMKDLFIPMKELPEFSDMYYRVIWKKYFYEK